VLWPKLLVEKLNQEDRGRSDEQLGVLDLSSPLKMCFILLNSGQPGGVKINVGCGQSSDLCHQDYIEK
jgi:hypothetical protein